MGNEVLRDIVVVDIDGTLHEYMHTVALVALSEFGIRIDTEPREWRFGLHPITDYVIGTEIFQRCHDREYIFLTNPYPGAADALKEIEGLGYSIIYLTDRKASSYQDTLDWLVLHGFPNPKGLKCCTDKRDVMLEYKNRIATIVDDRVRAQQFAQLALNCKHVFSIKQSTNINNTDALGYHILDTWAEIVEEFKKCDGDWELDWYA